MNENNTRYAIYFAPDSYSQLWRFGSQCLGYDAFSGEDYPFLDPLPLPQADWLLLTDEPRRYGFHATLKAPFTLKPEYSEAKLIAAFDHFSNHQSSVWLSGLQISCLHGFVALLPTSSSAELQVLAKNTVLAFEPFRAELSAQDIERRLKSPLSETQKAYLRQYGYPFVLDEFRFHMTLTGRLPTGECSHLANDLQDRFDTLVTPGPVHINRIALFKQSDRSGRFHIIHAAQLK
jgi:putative phosphonate metabolism protein